MRTYELGAVEITKRNRLPHWKTEHGVQFITVSLVDAIPVHVREQIREACDARAEMIRHTRGKLTIGEQRAIEVERRRMIERALDQSLGGCILADPALAKIVNDAIQYIDGWKYDLIAWSVMMNHLHMLYTSPKYTDGSIIRSLKGFTSTEINRLLNRRGSVWSEDYYDHTVRNSKELERVIRYIVNNPSKSGLDQWPFFGTRPERIQALL